MAKLPKPSLGFALSATLLPLIIAGFVSASAIDRSPGRITHWVVSDSQASPSQPRPKAAEPGTKASRAGGRSGSVSPGFHPLSPGEALEITSPNYPNDHYSDKSNKDIWFFRGTCTESIVSVTCSDFGLNKCLYSKVLFTGKNLQEKYCNKQPVFTVTSDNNEMTVTFRVRKYKGKKLRGFRCTVSASVPDPLGDKSSLDLGASASSTNQKSTCYCGQLNPSTRIFRGQETTMNKHPWQVEIVNRFDTSIRYCWGSLITSSDVILPAHCIADKNIFDIEIKIESHALNMSAGVYLHKIHPDYDSETLDNDIAVINIAALVPFTSDNGVAPVCLPDAGNSYDDVVATVNTWVGGEESQKDGSRVYEAVIPTMTQCKCKDAYGNNVTDNMICAGLEEGRRGACEADSGNALLTEGNCQGTFMVQIGISSWGSCGDPTKPRVYTRVSNYIEWINALYGVCPRP